jgi:hypothetical protein
LEALVIDGTRWEGICKVPVRYQDQREHSLEVVYGSNEPERQFRELINAQVIDSRVSDHSTTVTIRPLGTCDILFSSPTRPDFLVDGNRAEFEFDERSCLGRARLSASRKIDLTITASSRE